jgi:S1-C subfamily serine protease
LKRILSIGCVVAGVLGLASIELEGSPPAPLTDTGQRIIVTDGPSVFRLVPTNEQARGGTGFSATAPSGRPFTVTNAHVCELSTDGNMVAISNLHPKRDFRLRIIEISRTQDLCVLEAVPGTRGLTVSLTDPAGVLFALGHPLLKPLTLTSGYVTVLEPIDIGEPTTSLEDCKGEGRRVQSIDTLFGKQDICVRSHLAWGTSIEVFPGSSGSPVINGDNEVVGVVFASDPRDNKAYFVPGADLRRLLSAY